jgi:hypothetical protein
MKQWSEELRDRTYTEIVSMLTCTDPDGKLCWVIGTSLLSFARFKHISGVKFGKMTLENAIANYKAQPETRSYIIECEDRTEEVFKTVDALIEAGWVLD